MPVKRQLKSLCDGARMSHDSLHDELFFFKGFHVVLLEKMRTKLSIWMNEVQMDLCR